MTKKIAIVTGCAGFIGINLTNYLLARGWYVYGIDKLTHVANKDMLPTCSTFKFVQEDISTLTWLPDCDVIFNLAAESDVDSSNKNTKDFIHSNVLGVQNLLDIISNKITIKANKPVFIQVSTDEVYGAIAVGSFNESSELNPNNTYAASKASADLLIKSFCNVNNLEYIIARPSNNYGCYQYHEKLIPLVVKQLQSNKKIKLHDKGMPIRTWTFVQDTLYALEMLYDRAPRNRVYNISSEFEQNNFMTVSTILNAYNKVTHKNLQLVDVLDLNYSRPGQDSRYSISCKPLQELGWTSLTKFDHVIEGIVRYYSSERGHRW